jgi:ABC-type transporter Mla subunit MlaD
MGMRVSNLVELLLRVEEMLASATFALNQIEVGIDQAEAVRRIAIGTDVTEADEAISHVESALSTTAANITGRVAEIVATLDHLNSTVQEASDQVSASVHSASEKLQTTVSSLDDEAQSLIHNISDDFSAAEQSLEAFEGQLVHSVTDLVDNLNHNLAGTIDGALGSAADFMATLEATAQQTTTLVAQLDGSIANILRPLEEIEKVLAPVRSELSLIEKLA